MICFRQSRPKLAFVTALFAAWTLVLAFMGFVCAYAPGLWPYLGLSLFAPLTIAFAVAAALIIAGCSRRNNLLLGRVDGAASTAEISRRRSSIAASKRMDGSTPETGGISDGAGR